MPALWRTCAIPSSKTAYAHSSQPTSGVTLSPSDIDDPTALLPNRSDSFSSHVRDDGSDVLLDQICLIIFQRGTRFSINTTISLTLFKVTDKVIPEKLPANNLYFQSGSSRIIKTQNCKKKSEGSPFFKTSQMLKYHETQNVILFFYRALAIYV